jgi:hypothetical protein
VSDLDEREAPERVTRRQTRIENSELALLPISNRGDGRDAMGRFGAGNRLGKGGTAKYARVLGERLSVALEKGCRQEDIDEVIAALVKQAKSGDTSAIKLLLERLQPLDSVVALRIEQVERALGISNSEVEA